MENNTVEKMAEDKYPMPDESLYPVGDQDYKDMVWVVNQKREAFIEGFKASAGIKEDREVWVPVSVEELPKKTGWYWCIDPNAISYTTEREVYRFDDYNESWYDFYGNCYHPSHWLKKVKLSELIANAPASPLPTPKQEDAKWKIDFEPSVPSPDVKPVASHSVKVQNNIEQVLKDSPFFKPDLYSRMYIECGLTDDMTTTEKLNRLFLIIAGMEEGSEQWKAKCEDLEVKNLQLLRALNTCLNALLTYGRHPIIEKLVLPLLNSDQNDERNATQPQPDQGDAAGNQK